MDQLAEAAASASCSIAVQSHSGGGGCHSFIAIVCRKNPFDPTIGLCFRSVHNWFAAVFSLLFLSPPFFVGHRPPIPAPLVLFFKPLFCFFYRDYCSSCHMSQQVHDGSSGQHHAERLDRHERGWENIVKLLLGKFGLD